MDIAPNYRDDLVDPPDRPIATEPVAARLALADD
jgi:hypothetical protein